MQMSHVSFPLGDTKESDTFEKQLLFLHIFSDRLKNLLKPYILLCKLILIDQILLKSKCVNGVNKLSARFDTSC